MLTYDKVYLMDAHEFLDAIKDCTVDLAVIDPPYNLKKAKWDSFKTQQHFLDFTFSWVDKLIPKLKNGSAFYIFNTPFNSAYILQHLVNRGLYFQNWITWDKRDGMSATKSRYVNGQETILFFTKGKPRVFNYNLIRIPYDSTDRIKHAMKKGILKNGKRWYPNPIGKLCGEVWHFSSERHKNKVNGKTPKLPHLTPKPLDMIERIITASSSKGDVVLDCFVGSGTTAVAAKKLGRKFICCDNSRKFVKIARNRLKFIKPL